MVQRRWTEAKGSTQVVCDETGATRNAAARRRAPAQSPARHDEDGDDLNDVAEVYNLATYLPEMRQAIAFWEDG